MRMSTGTLGSLSLAVSLVVAAPAWAEERVGVVTTVIGPVTLTRASLPEEPLKFKDDIFLRDRITTGDNAMTRILMGGKVVVTARERSTLTITEVPGLSTIDLTSGRIAVAVDKTRMKPGERVDVRTPNAIAGVRGTVLIVETRGTTSSVTVLRGLVDVVRLDPATGHAVGPVTPVGAQQAVTVRNNVLPAKPQTITPDRSRKLSEEFTPPMRTVAETSVMPVKDEVARATTLLNQLLPPQPVTQATAVAGTPSTSTETSSTLTNSTATVLSTTPSLAAPTTTLVTTTTTSLTQPTTTLVAPTTTLVAPTTTLVPTTTVAPTTTIVPTTTTVSSTPTLLQPVLQPVVQNVVQPVLDPVTRLLK